jgi:hypothetical protein
MKSFITLFLVSSFLFSCVSNTTTGNNITGTTNYVQQRLAAYAPVLLTANLSTLTSRERQMLPLLIQASQIMDSLFWLQAYGNPDNLLSQVRDDNTRKFLEINYGPWDRLNNDTPFISGIGPKPLGAAFYPADITKEELEKSNVPDKMGQYSIIRRDAGGNLISVPYHVAYKAQLERASQLLKQASALADDPGLKNYLNLRGDALITSNYTASDIAWMDMKNNTIDIIIGPIENYEDRLYNARTAFTSYVLIKDKEWSQRLAKYVAMLPKLQEELPVDAKYKTEKPGVESELNAYDIVFYAGQSNAGSKTIAVNLPNDEELQKTKGTRRSQLKNAMQAKFDKILVHIAQELIDPTQLNNITFDAFFSNVMFHEVAHGLGIKTTINGKGTVRAALQEQNSALEEGKADILGLYMVTKLVEQNELQGKLEDFYTTYMAGILRSVRFGASSAHGKANMVNFNFFAEKGAFERTANGHYKVNFDKFRIAMNELSAHILTLQGNGDKAGVEALMKEKGVIKPQLKADLDRLQQKGIPVDISFEQGIKTLNL